MARSKLDTPDSIGGQQNLGTPYADLAPGAKPIGVFQKATTQELPDAQTHNQYTNLANALGELQPTLTQGVGYLQKIDEERLTGEAITASNKIMQEKNIAGIKEAMKNGLPPGASPIYIKAWKENLAKLAGEQSDTLMRQDYFQNDKLRNSDDPEAFNQWASQWRHDFMKGVLTDADGKPQFTGLELANSRFNETVQKNILSLNNEHINHRVGERGRLGRENAQNLAQKRLDEFFDKSSIGEVNWAGAGAAINDVWYNKATGYVSAGGVLGSQATSDMTDAIINKATTKGDVNILDLANFIETPGGKLAGTQTWRDKVAHARLNIETVNYQRRLREEEILKQDQAGDRETRIARYKGQYEQTDSALARDKYVRDHGAGILLAPAYTDEDRAKRSEALKELYKVDWAAGANLESIMQKQDEHKEVKGKTATHHVMYANLLKEVLDNPTAPDIEQKIAATFKYDGIDDTQMRSMLNMVDSYRQKANQPNAMKDPIYEHLEKSVYSSSVADMMKIGGMEALEAGKAQFEFRIEALELIKHDPSLANNPRALAEAMEKRVKPIVERHNAQLKKARDTDEAQKVNQKETVEQAEYIKSAAWFEQEQKIKKNQEALQTYDKGKGPDPRTETKQPTIEEMGGRLSGYEKRTLEQSFRLLHSPGTEKPITQQDARDMVRSIFSRHYTNEKALNDAVNGFMEAQKPKPKKK